MPGMHPAPALKGHTMNDSPTLLTVAIKLHGAKYETRHDADAVLASDWAADTKSMLRSSIDSTLNDCVIVERDANLGEARRLANAAAAACFSAKRPDMKPWEARGLNAKLALRFVRKVR